jgi:hypothetical protein
MDQQASGWVVELIEDPADFRHALWSCPYDQLIVHAGDSAFGADEGLDQGNHLIKGLAFEFEYLHLFSRSQGEAEEGKAEIKTCYNGVFCGWAHPAVGLLEIGLVSK